MRIFIVNLVGSVERKAKMSQQLESLGLQHDFIEAIDGRLMSESERADVSRKINYAFLPGEIGCALSHQKIYQKMIDENIESALILEDDVILPRNFNEILHKITLKDDAPSVLLLSRINKYFKEPIANVIDNYNIHKTQHATTAHSYIINKSGAESLLKSLSPIWMTADKWSLFEVLSLIKVHSVVPHPVILSEESTISTINTVKGDDEINLKKKQIWDILMKRRPLLAKLKHRYRRAITPIFHKITDQGKG